MTVVIIVISICSEVITVMKFAIFTGTLLISFNVTNRRLTIVILEMFAVFFKVLLSVF